MADSGRKDFTQSMSPLPLGLEFPPSNTTAEATEEITPDSMKSTQDKTKEAATDTTDRVARGLQSDESKSGTQEAFDKGQRAHDNEHHGGATSSV